MQKRQRLAHVLLPGHQPSSEAVPPPMGPLYPPAASRVAGFTRERLGFFTPCPAVSGEAKRGQQVAHFSDVIAFVQPQPLWRLERSTGRLVRVAWTIWPSCRLALSPARPIGTSPPSVSMLRVVPICRRSVEFVPTFFPHGELWSSPRPWPATPSQYPVPRRPGSPRPPPTPGSSGAPHSWNRGPCPGAHALGTRFEGRRSWQPWPDDPRRVAGGTAVGGASAAGVTAGCAPTARRVAASHAERSLVRGS
jgi:hypothetical protein